MSVQRFVRLEVWSFALGAAAVHPEQSVAAAAATLAEEDQAGSG
jgi:hypothetical protein